MCWWCFRCTLKFRLKIPLWFDFGNVEPWFRFQVSPHFQKSTFPTVQLPRHCWEVQMLIEPQKLSVCVFLQWSIRISSLITQQHGKWSVRDLWPVVSRWWPQRPVRPLVGAITLLRRRGLLKLLIMEEGEVKDINALTDLTALQTRASWTDWFCPCT